MVPKLPSISLFLFLLYPWSSVVFTLHPNQRPRPPSCGHHRCLFLALSISPIPQILQNATTNSGGHFDRFRLGLFKVKRVFYLNQPRSLILITGIFGYQFGEFRPLQPPFVLCKGADLRLIALATSQWISWFLSSKGNEYFCEVEEDYILDRFNLTGLNTEVANYSQALDLITDNLGL